MIVFRQCLPCAVVWVDATQCWVCGQKGSNLKGEPPGNKGQHVRWENAEDEGTDLHRG